MAGIIRFSFMKQNLFSGGKSKPIADLTREEFMEELASVGRPETQRFFVRSYNPEIW
jgi:hypothetical protein